jgi:hypothetical protein
MLRKMVQKGESDTPQCESLSKREKENLGKLHRNTMLHSTKIQFKMGDLRPMQQEDTKEGSPGMY